MTVLAGLAQPAEAQRGGARYAGSTSQGEGVTLQVSRSARTVTTLEATIVAVCGDRRPDRGIYQLADIAIRDGAFAARQRLGSAAGARAVLRATGRFARRGRVRGRLGLRLRRPADEERDATTCRAHVSFSAQLPQSARNRFGALAQLEGRGSCFAGRRHRGGCRIEPLFEQTTGSSDLAISPDGRNVYAAVGRPAEQDDIGAHLPSAIVVFVRDRTTGRLHRLAGAAGCIREKGGEGCASGRGLRTVEGIRVSNDGRHVYAASPDGIAVLQRDAATGGLSQSPGPDGCVTTTSIADCGAITGYDSFFLADSPLELGPRGHYVYLLGKGSLAVFVRNRSTGRLTQLPGKRGCIRVDGDQGCARAPRIGDSWDLAASPDGRHLYRMSLLDPPELALLRRERRTKILRESRVHRGCFSGQPFRGCGRLRGVTYVNSGALSPDGRHLYAGEADSGLAVFARNRRTGMLRQLPGAAGCVLEDPGAGCGAARGVEGGEYPTVSPDGRNVYLNGGFSLVAFARNRRTGELLQLPGRAGCIAQSLSDDYRRCAHPVQRNWATTPMEVSPDGHHLYAITGGFLTVYARRTRP
jgi:DNA-binding beta-propeller fold protein YncE